MKTVFFDLLGTIIHHKTYRPLPLMKELIQAFKHKRWSVVIVSSCSKGEAEKLLQKAGIKPPTAILSSSKSKGGEKGEVIAQYLATHPSEQNFFVDDKRANLESVKNQCGDRVRVIGFVGSRKYVPALSAWCTKNRVELAISTPDLCAGLGFEARLSGQDDERLLNWKERELIDLLPGSPDTIQRAVFAFLLERKGISDFDYLWRNIAWMSCPECPVEFLVLAFVASVLKYLGSDLYLLNSGTGAKHTQALKDFVARNPDLDFHSAFTHALAVLKQGRVEIGVEAEKCRISGRHIAHDRIEKVENRLIAVFRVG